MEFFVDWEIQKMNNDQLTKYQEEKHHLVVKAIGSLWSDNITANERVVPTINVINSFSFQLVKYNSKGKHVFLTFYVKKLMNMVQLEHLQVLNRQHTS